MPILLPIIILQYGKGALGMTVNELNNKINKRLSSKIQFFSTELLDEIKEKRRYRMEKYCK